MNDRIVVFLWAVLQSVPIEANDAPWRSIDADDGHLRWVEFSPDGDSVGCCGDRFIRVFNIASGDLVREFGGHDGHLHRFAFTSDGTRIASAGHDSTVRVWDTSGGEQLATLTGHSDSVIGVSFSQDGRWLASASAYDDGTVRVWDTATWGECARACFPDRNNAMFVAFSPDGGRLVASGYKAEIRVYEFNGEELQLRYVRRHGDQEMVPHVVFSPDGTMFVSSSWDRTLRAWQTETGEELWSADAPAYARCYEAAAFSPGGETVYAVTRDETIERRDARTGELQSSLRWQDEVRGLDVSPDGKFLATTGHRGRIKLWKIDGEADGSAAQ